LSSEKISSLVGLILLLLGAAKGEIMAQSEIDSLLNLGVPEDASVILLTAAHWLEASGGPLASSYWRSVHPPLIERQRDEFFVAVALAINGLRLIFQHEPNSEWRLGFDVAYLYQAKPLVQAVQSINCLCSSRCYADSLTVVRALHSRAQLLVLFSLEPLLFDEWLESPEHLKYRDARVRKELSNHGLDLYPHFYHWFSDLVHGRPEGLCETGHFESGLYPSLPVVENTVFVSAKLLLAVIGWTAISSIIVDCEGAGVSIPDDVARISGLYIQLSTDLFHPARLDHLMTTIPQDRHLSEPDARGYAQVKWFGYEKYQQCLRDFRIKLPKRQLGRDYSKTV